MTDNNNNMIKVELNNQNCNKINLSEEAVPCASKVSVGEVCKHGTLPSAGSVVLKLIGV